MSFFKKYKAEVESDLDDDDDVFNDINWENKEIPMQANRESRYPVRQRRISQRYGDVMATD